MEDCTGANVMLKSDLEFKALCEFAGVKASTRQASKYRGGRGLAFKAKGKYAEDKAIRQNLSAVVESPATFTETPKTEVGNG